VRSAFTIDEEGKIGGFAIWAVSGRRAEAVLNDQRKRPEGRDARMRAMIVSGSRCVA
jgi:hypothetical protein